MKKATKFTIYLSLQIIALCSIGMAFTYLNDWLQQSGFFGDTPVKPFINYWGVNISTDGEIDKNWYWGPRHYWYFFMCLALFLVSCGRLLKWAFDYWDD